MHFFGPVQYQPDWLEALARHHKDDAFAIALYPAWLDTDRRWPGRDLQLEQVGALNGLRHAVMGTDEKTPVSITRWKGREIAEQTGTKLVGSQYSTDYTVIVI